MWWDIQMDPQKTITLSCAPSWGHPTPKDMVDLLKIELHIESVHFDIQLLN